MQLSRKLLVSGEDAFTLIIRENVGVFVVDFIRIFELIKKNSFLCIKICNRPFAHTARTNCRCLFCQSVKTFVEGKVGFYSILFNNAFRVNMPDVLLTLRRLKTYFLIISSACSSKH